MQKLLDGIREFHQKLRPEYIERFAHLALGQSPDCLFVACSDSRVVPNLFASTDPGDLFVVRNVGNIVPPSVRPGVVGQGGSTGAAVEYALLTLNVGDIVVCGHSSCGAMRALSTNELPPEAPELRSWLRHAKSSLARLEHETRLNPSLDRIDRLSQAHVLQQLDHLRSYPSVAERLADGRTRVHGWWFDLHHAQVLAYDGSTGGFTPLVEQLDRS